MIYTLGDLILVPFPFTDQKKKKKRPAVIVSNQTYHENYRDLIIMAITSQIRQPLSLGEGLVVDWKKSGLLKPSVFKPVFTTIEQNLVIKKMGALSATDLNTLRQIMAKVIG